MGKFKEILTISLKRFPETIIISVIFVGILITENHMAYDKEQALIKLALIAALGIPLSASWVLTFEKLKLKSIWRSLGAIALAIYAIIFYLLRPDVLDETFMIRYAFGSAILYFLFTLVPYLWQRAGYGKYCVKIITSFMTTYLYTLVLYLGFIAIIFTIDRLFSLNLSNDWYFDIFIIATGIFGLTYFLGRVPTINDKLEDYCYPKILQVLFTAIVMPLIVLYTLVLYAYLVRIIVSVGWEDGFVSQLVIWYGFISLALMILLYPIKNVHKMVSKFYKYYPIALIVPLIMLGISIGIRLNAYGLTVLRGMVILALVWFVYGVLVLLFFKVLKVQWLVIGFILIFGLGVLSPVNVINVSIHGQVNRLTEELEDLNMLKEGDLYPRNDIADGNMRGISSILDFLLDYRGLEDVPYLPEGFELKDMEDVFGFSYMNAYYYQDEFGRSYISYYQDDLLVNIEGYAYHQPVTSRFNDREQVSGEIFVVGGEETIELYVDGDKVYETVVSEILDEQGYDLDFMSGDDDKLIRVEADFEDGKVMMVFTNINGYEEDGEFAIEYYEVDVYLSLK